ncbi:MAG TPA: SdrD B-like domain-containing protein [Candidatus Thermoplasmatota archaeon]|nr:SdrD B-like domain-containing protein [Candidatus Thermoplasmatota archaeon]
MAYDSSKSTGSRSALYAGAALVAIFLLALFVRSYWAIDAAHTDGNFVLSGGSDGYYIKHAVDHVQANGWKTLVEDPLLNYPLGGVNPNPPLFVWSIAVAGQAAAPFFGGDLETATWWVALWSPAIWGALTIIPAYFIGKALYSRRVGLVAAFFLAIAPQHIGQSNLGDTRHYAISLFFIVLTAFFFIKAVQGIYRQGNWVSSWSDPAARRAGIASLFRERKQALGFALLAGLSLGAEALVWKGFPYLIVMMFGYAVLEMLFDHWKNRDSLGLFVVTSITVAVGLLMAMPYYLTANIMNFMNPAIFLLAGYLVVGLVLTPTRDLPTILVFPAFLVAGLIGLAVAFFAIPEVSVSLLYALVYFKQNRLYQTIAEAHPADFNSMAFAAGPAVFFLALIGFFMAIRRSRKEPSQPHLFMVVWLAIALYMAQSATRFLFNATPILSILGAWVLVRIVTWLDYGAIAKAIRGTGGSVGAGLRRGINGWHVTGAALIALTLVVPNVVLAVDAGTTFEWERRASRENPSWAGFIDQRLGAFGPGFLPDYWDESLTWLANYDSHIANEAERPAFLAWWDYGHWAIAVGEHPTVADNFQNGYVFAANFLLSQNETNAIQLLSARLIDPRNGVTESQAKALMVESGLPANKTDITYKQLLAFEYAPAMDLATANAFYQKVMAATGDQIRYVAADIRMLPYDNPQTPDIDQTSIYYAPVVLAGKNPKDYVELKYVTTSGDMSEEEFSRVLRNPNTPATFQATGQKYDYKQAFFNSMYYRTYVGSPVETGGRAVGGDRLLQGLNIPQPGYGLAHFRLVHANDQMKLLEYYEGANVTGVVIDGSTNQPIAGALVTAYDDAGRIILQSFPAQFRDEIPADDLNVPHDSAVTDADGRYQVLAPFSMPGGNVTIVASRGAVELGRATFEITREQARSGYTVPEALGRIVVQRGSVEGTVFLDRDGNGRFEGADEPVENVVVSIGGKNATTDSAGRYRVSDVPAGSQTVSLVSSTYSVEARSSVVSVRPGQTATHNVSASLVPAPVSGHVWADLNGNGVEDAGEAAGSVTLAITPDTNTTARAPSGSPQTDASGNYNTSLTPGRYTVAVAFTSGDGRAWEHQGVLEVARDGTPIRRDIQLTPKA